MNHGLEKPEISSGATSGRIDNLGVLSLPLTLWVTKPDISQGILCTHFVLCVYVYADCLQTLASV